MKAERCREWRLSLGAYALGNLPAEERAGLEAHLNGCPDCRAEAESLGAVAQLLPLADPDRFSHPAPQPSPELGKRIAATIGGERRVGRRPRRWQFGPALSGAAAAAAAGPACEVPPRRGGGQPRQRVAFASLPAGGKIDATPAPPA